MDTLDRFRGCLIGLAVGDAIGTTVEFQSRGTFPLVKDMVGQGPFGLKAGEWTDDTSMALCLATSLVEKKGFDAADQMERYWRWYREGYLSSNGACFDIGNTVRQALERYKETRMAFSGSTDVNAAGNGSIMRLAPISDVLFSRSGSHSTLFGRKFTYNTWRTRMYRSLLLIGRNTLSSIERERKSGSIDGKSG